MKYHLMSSRRRPIPLLGGYCLLCFSLQIEEVSPCQISPRQYFRRSNQWTFERRQRFFQAALSVSATPGDRRLRRIPERWGSLSEVARAPRKIVLTRLPNPFATHSAALSGIFKFPCRNRYCFLRFCAVLGNSGKHQRRCRPSSCALRAGS